MLQNFTVKNFRCFQSLGVGPFDRVNLIAGRNNTGKTALLEAIRLHCDPSNCQLPLSINKERGVEGPGQTLEDDGNWLFWDRNPAHAIELASQDDRGITRSLTIHLVDALTAGERFPKAV